MFPFWKMIPYTRPHGGIVIGKGGHHIQHLSRQMGCMITAKNAEPERKRFKPYFLIEGYNERAIFMATIQIQSLLMESMATMGQKQHMEITDLGQQNQHLNLEVADKALQIKQLGEKHMSSNEDSDDDDDDDDEDDGITITGLSIN
jgi:hypothetical protein